MFCVFSNKEKTRESPPLIVFFSFGFPCSISFTPQQYCLKHPGDRKYVLFWLLWIWVKLEPPGYGPQVVLGSMYQCNRFILLGGSQPFGSIVFIFFVGSVLGFRISQTKRCSLFAGDAESDSPETERSEHSTATRWQNGDWRCTAPWCRFAPGSGGSTAAFELSHGSPCPS